MYPIPAPVFEADALDNWFTYHFSRMDNAADKAALMTRFDNYQEALEYYYKLMANSTK